MNETDRPGGRTPPRGSGAGQAKREAVTAGQVSGQRAHWIVQGRDVVAGKLDRALTGNDVEQVERVASDLVVLSMTADRAKRLQADFPELIIEPNASLEPLRRLERRRLDD